MRAPAPLPSPAPEGPIASPEAVRAAEAQAEAAGLAMSALMAEAAAAVAAAIRGLWPERRPVLVLAGPGKNGADGRLTGEILTAEGYPVTVLALESTTQAALEAALAEGPLVLDALFGIGLNRPLTGLAAAIPGWLEASALKGPVVALDIASGVEAASGAAAVAIRADHTLALGRLKPGHVLWPGRRFAGRVAVLPLAGLAEPALWREAPAWAVNGPALWRAELPRLQAEAHKYSRGAVLVTGSGAMPGAGLLAALAARRAGAGLVSLTLPEAVAPMAALAQPGLVVRGLKTPEELRGWLGDPRLNAVVVGPGLSQSQAAETMLNEALMFTGARVFDADALTLLARHVRIRFGGTRTVLTPHEGEFRRLAPDLAGVGGGSRLQRALAAAERLGCVVVLKGPDTVVASAEGRAAVLAAGAGAARLATAGSGDVLAGVIGSLMAQGMAPFEAASAGVWLHARAAEAGRPGLIAEDLPEGVAAALAEMTGG